MHGGSIVAMPQPLPVLPKELVAEILSLLEVKSLMRFRCVNKSFKSLISDPHFVQMHLKNSARNPLLTVMSIDYTMSLDNSSFDRGVLNLPMPLLLKNPSTTIHCVPYFGLNEDYRRWWVIGSCNGLLCLYNLNYDCDDSRRLCLWNPATRKKSEFVLASSHRYYDFSFCYDNLNGTYKVVAYHVEKDEHGTPITEMKVYSLRDNYLINIQCFPAVVLLNWYCSRRTAGVYLRGTINWLAVQDDYYLNYCNITIEQYVILSLDLSTETYTQLLLPRGFGKLPRGFDKVPQHQPTLVVLMDCLYFGHDFQKTHFVMWKMKDFGDQESWIQLYKIPYKSLCSTMEFKCHRGLLPLYLSENGDTLILTNEDNEGALIYNCKGKRVGKIRITDSDNTLWSHAKNYVESLVSTC